jgi:predicted RNA-binding Zn-ribbon protein involved in translation (DUF1610 family)
LWLWSYCRPAGMRGRWVMDSSGGVLRMAISMNVDPLFLPPVGGEYFPVVDIGGRVLYVACAYWLILVGCALSLCAFLVFSIRRRPRPGVCRTCGYDLRGNVSGRCPECGELTGRSEGCRTPRRPTTSTS